MSKPKDKSEKKVYTLDTSVILHDRECYLKFEEHDVTIPTTVLEELDKFKSGNTEKNYNAREFIRTLDKLRNEKVLKSIHGKQRYVSKLSNGGILLGEGKGNIEVKVSRYASKHIKDTFPEDIGDHRILGLALEMSKDTRETRKVVLITKDINLRMKADSLNIDAEDFENDKVDASKIYPGRTIIENFPADQVATLYSEVREINTNALKTLYKEPLHPNMYFILGKESTGLARFDAEKDRLVRVSKQTIAGITPRNSEQTFSVNALMNPEIKLVTLMGVAGTGKTLLAMAAGLEQLQQGKYEQIIVTAPIIPVGNKDPGFLPGDFNDKVSPYMQGIFDNLAFIRTQVGKKDAKWLDGLTNAERDGRIKIQPLASIRGRSFNNTFFVLDETQNTTPHEVKTTATRAGENTKMIFCGDIEQIDVPYLDTYSNGLSHVIAHFTNQQIFAHITLEKGERSELARLAAQLL